MKISLFCLLTLMLSIIAISGNAAEPLSIIEGGSVIKEITPIVSLEKEIETLVPLEEIQVRYLVGNFEDVPAVVYTDIGPQTTLFNGEIAFKVVPGKEGEINLVLESLNLVSKGVQTEAGKARETGVIGLALTEPGTETTVDPKTGEFSTEFQSMLHYPLIDEVMGFISGESEECAVFYSYTEGVKGTITGSFPDGLRIADEGEVPFRAQINMELSNKVLAIMPSMMLKIDISKMFWYLTRPTEILNVQPVFIGTGPADTATMASVYDTLIKRASEIWNRCGSVRCISLRSLPPVYVSNTDYLVLNSEAEAVALQGTVNVANAVEVFVADRWDPYMDGGGACWSCGTASAKVVTCAQQLSVPCPPPSPPCSGGPGDLCGDVNYYHLGHELGHALGLAHPGYGYPGFPGGSYNSIMEPSGFCLDNPAVQSAFNCRSASNPLLYWGRDICAGTPDIMD